VLAGRVISCPSFGVFKDPRQDRNNSTHSFALLFFSPIFIEQKKLRKFIIQISKAPLIFVSLSILRFMAFHGKRCSLLSHFLFIRVALLWAPLRYGSLEVEKTSSCSKPYTALMRVVKRKEVESFFTLCRNVSEGKQDGIRLT